MNRKKHIPLLLSCGHKYRLLGSLLILMALSTSLFAQTSITGAGTNFKHDDDKGQHNALLRISDTMAILAYSGYKNLGYVRTFSMAADGSATAQLGELRFDTDDGYDISMVQLNSDIFVIAYRGRNGDGYITAIKVSADGKTISQGAQEEHDKEQGFSNSIVKVDDNTVAVLYKGDESGSSSIIKTFDVATDGSSITQVATNKLGIVGNHHKIISMGGDKYVTIFEKSGTMYIKTSSISANGQTISIIAEETESGAGTWSDIVKMDGDTYAVAYYGTSKLDKDNSSGNGQTITTYDIPADGSSIAKVTTLRHMAYSGQRNNSLVKIADNFYAHAFSNRNNHGVIKTFYMPNDGKLISKISNLTFYSSTSSYISMAKMDLETFMVAYTDPSNKGVLYTADIRADLPFFKEVSLAPDNATVTVTFNEPVYNTGSGSGNLEASDFKMTLSGGQATLTSTTPSSISVSGNVYTLGIPLDGSGKKPKGDELLLVNPLADEIFDGTGNKVVAPQDYYGTTPSGTTQRNKKTLNDQFPPHISSVLAKLPVDNSYIEATFNEPVFTNNNGSGDLVAADFVLSVSGGTGTLSSATPSKVTKSSNTYKLEFSLASISNGSETIKVDLASNAVFDAAGNVAEATQTNNTSTLRDGRLKITHDGSMYNSTSTYFTTIRDSRTGQFLTYFKRGGTGYIYAHDINGDGSGFNYKSNLQVSPSINYGFPSMIKGPRNLYITADAGHEYEIGKWGGAIRTISFLGGTTAPVILDNLLLSKTYGSSDGTHTNLVALNDSIYLAAYTSSSGSKGYVSSYKINPDGKINHLFDLQHDANRAYFPKMVKVDNNTVAMAYEGYNWSGWGGWIKTFTVSPNDGKITKGSDERFTTSYSNTSPDLIQLNENIYVLAYSGASSDGYIETWSISNEGAVTLKKQEEHDKDQGTMPSLMKTGPNTVFLAYSGVGNNGLIKSFDIPTDGSTITENISFEHESNQATYSELFQVDSDTYGLNYYNRYGYGYIKLFNNLFATADKMTPEISTVSLDSDNSKIAVTFNEPIYTATGATTQPVAGDFALSMTGGTATLSSATPSKIEISGSTYTLTLPISGTPNGSEVLTINPSSGSAIYDASDNAASATQMRNTVYLNDKTPPKIIATATQYNEFVNITFEEPVFGNIYHGSLSTSDFSLSMTGGTATLSSTTPTGYNTTIDGEKVGTNHNGETFNGSKLQLKLGLNGTPNGEEKITVSPATNAIFDAAGNVANTSQSAGSSVLTKSSILPGASYTFNTDRATDASVVHLRDSLYAVAYSGPSYKGFLQTFNASLDGKRVSKITEIQFDTRGIQNSMVKADDNTIVLAYRGPGDDGWIKTYNIDSNGRTISLGNDLRHNTAHGWVNSLIKVDQDTYVLAYQQGSGWAKTYISSFTIPPDGSKITEERQVNAQQEYNVTNSLVKGEPGFFIHASGPYNRSLTTWGAHITTYSINETGDQMSVIARKNINNNGSSSNSYFRLLKMDEDTYIHVSSQTSRGELRVLTISKDGGTITVEDDQRMAFVDQNTTSGLYSSLLKINSKNFALFSRDRLANGWIMIYTLADDGKSIKNHWRYELEKTAMQNGVESALFQVNGSTIGAAWSDNSTHGNISLLALDTEDKDKPKILSSFIGNDNQFITVELNEPVYKADTGIGWLEKADFSLSLTGGTASLSSTIPTSINEYGNREGKSYELGLGLSGTPDGNEVVTVSFANNSVYDGNGNIGDVTQSNNTVTLNEKTLPKIIASTISGDNRTVTVTFSEPIYNTANGSGGLQETDFTLSLSTGSAVLQNSTPASIAQSGNTYTLQIKYSGIADGTEVLTIQPASNAIFDKVGNISATTQSNNQLSLNEVKILEIAKAEYNIIQGKWNSIVKVDDDTYALAYQGRYNYGHIQTFGISADGITITKVHPHRFETSSNSSNAFIRVDDDTYALAYAGSSNKGYIKTFDINASGTSVSQKSNLPHDNTDALWNSFIHLNGTTYMLAYAGGSAHGWVKTFTITDNGSSIVELDKLEHDDVRGRYNALHKMTDSTVVLAYSNDNLQVSTFKIATDGKITEVDQEEIYNGVSSWNSIAQVDSNTYLISSQGLNEDGYLYTIDVPKDGSSISVVVKDYEHEESFYEAGSLLATGSNTYVLAYRGDQTSTHGLGMIKLMGVGGDGKNLKQLYSTKHADTNGHNSLVKIDADTYGLAFYGSDWDGFMKTFTVKATDSIIPKIAYLAIKDNNASVDVTFTEPIYSSATASGEIEAADFALSITGGTATLQSTEPTSIVANGNTYTLGFTLIGTADGKEVLKVLPVSNSIYDGGGNAASTSQSTNNTKNLFDKAGPKIIKTTLAADNKSADVTFDENVFSTSTSSGKLDKNDFNLTVSGGSANISSATPLTSVESGGKKFKLTFTVTGSPDGNEVLTILPVKSSIYDTHGNASPTIQSNNTSNLQDIVAPTIDSLSISSDNDIVEVAFNEDVFGKGDATTKLDTSDFVYSLSGGSATLSKNYPSSVTGTGTGKKITLGVLLSGLPDGSEIITVLPADSAVFDRKGNVAKTTQSNNTTRLMDKVIPYFKKTSLSPSNSEVNVTFSEKVYAKTNSTGVLDTADFVFTLTGGTAKLVKAYPDSITSTENTYNLKLKLDGVPDGSETLVFAPKENAIFDSSGNPASTTQLNNSLNLYDKAPPIISDLNLAADNSTLNITFNESVYSKADGTGDLEKSDFVFSLVGGQATLTTPFATSITKSSKTYTVGVGIKGEPNGNELLTVLIVDKSIFDAAGNAAAIEQTKNKIQLNDQNAPMISKLELAPDNSTLEVTFDEKVFSSFDGTGVLDSADFILTINEGAAKLSQKHPSKITLIDTIKTYSLELPLTGTADGNEVLTITLAAENIYDESGTVAAPTQINNKVRLYDLYAPMITETILDSDNQKVNVRFTVPVFATTKATGLLETNDFVLSLDGGSATLQSTTPSSIDSSDNGTRYILGIDLLGVPDGREVLTINPVDNNIFDDAANSANKVQSNNSVNLFDKTPPTITGVNISNTNDTLTVTFSEPIFSNNDSSGAIVPEDFIMTITGGIAGLTSATPSSATAAAATNTYHLVFAVSGTPDGYEELSILPGTNSVFDSAGNAAEGVQDNNTIYLNDLKPPLAPTGLTGIAGNEKVTLLWTANPEKDILKYYVYGGTDPTSNPKIDSTNYGNNTTEITGLTNKTTYYFRISAFDRTGFESEKTDTISVMPDQKRAFTVKEDGTGDYTDIQGAIDAAASGDTVYISSGTYDSIRVDSKSLEIIAGSGPASSIIDAKGKTTAVILSGYPNQTAITGFTIKDGVGDNNADGNGGGIRVEAGVNAKIDNCIITGNEDGAIFFGDSSKSQIANTLVYGNDKSMIFGSGIADLINCTFIEEKENSVITDGASVNFVNTIFMDQVTATDTSNNISVWANYSLFKYGDNAFNSNQIKSFNWGSTNLMDDPLFVDTLNADFHLTKDSPAIGVGTASFTLNNLTYDAPSKDIEGNNRPSPNGSAPDLGVYESPYSNSSPKANFISDGDTDSLEIDFSTSTSTLSAHWKPFASTSSIYYEYAIGIDPKLSDVLDWTIIGFDTFKVVNDLELKNSTKYLFSVRGKNEQGESATITTDGVFIDWEKPKVESVTEWKTDLDWFGPSTPGVVVANATDNGGIAKYEYSIGITEGDSSMVDWTPSDSNVVHLDVSHLVENVTYYSNTRVTDYVGFTATGSSNGFKMDISAPEIGKVSIGDEYQADTSQVTYVWSDFTDAQSGIGDYHFSLGTTPDGQDVLPRKSFGLDANFTSVAITIGNLSLQEDLTYYGTIYAIDRVGNESFRISEGLTIDRTGPGDGTVADGSDEDRDYANDTLNISVNWYGFKDINGVEKYELALDTINTATDSTVWVNVGKDSSYTFTDQELRLGTKYYTMVQAFDKLGNASNVVSSDGFVIDLDGPKVATTSPSTAKLVGVFEKLEVDIAMSEEIASANIEYASTQGDILNIDPIFTVDKTNIKVTFKPPFTSGDEVKILVQATDLAGNASPFKELLYTISYLADYDFSGGVDWKDLNEFVKAFNANDLSKELGPVTRAAPHFRPAPDSLFNTRDAMAFVRMWNWDKNKNSGKLIAKVLPTEGIKLNAEFEADHMMIYPPKGTKAMEVILNYPVMDLSMGMPIKEAVTDEAITLSRVDTVAGQILLNTAYFVKNNLPIRIDLNHLQKDNNIPVDISYQFIDDNNQILSSGSEVLEIIPIPTDFALHNNFPNPFNPVTTINYDLPKEANVSLIVYDLMGREVTRLTDNFMPAGYHTVRWNARNQFGMEVSAGVYFYHIQAGEFVKTQKMILLK